MAITRPAEKKMRVTAHAPRYLPASARMMAERAEQGTKVLSTEGKSRSRPVVIAAALESAGTLHPRPVRNVTATPPWAPMRRSRK